MLTLKRCAPSLITLAPSSNRSFLSRRLRMASCRAVLSRESSSSAFTLSLSSSSCFDRSPSFCTIGSAAKYEFSSSSVLNVFARRATPWRMRSAAANRFWARRWRSSTRVCLRASKASNSSSRFLASSAANSSSSLKRPSSSSSCTCRRASSSSHFSGLSAPPSALSMLWPRSLNWAPNSARRSVPSSSLRRPVAWARTRFRWPNTSLMPSRILARATGSPTCRPPTISPSTSRPPPRRSSSFVSGSSWLVPPALSTSAPVRPI